MVIKKKWRTIFQTSSSQGSEYAHTVFGTLRTLGQVWQLCTDYFRKGRVQIRQANRRGIRSAVRVLPAIAHAAHGPRGEERHTMAALVATPLVTTKGAAGDVAIFLRTIITGENDKSVGN